MWEKMRIRRFGRGCWEYRGTGLRYKVKAIRQETVGGRGLRYKVEAIRLEAVGGRYLVGGGWPACPSDSSKPSRAT
jgi:hypothetical protein